MMPDPVGLLASFTAPIHIGTTHASLLWMFPLLAAISVIYKVTKMRVFFFGRFARDVLVLFITISLFMIGAMAALNVIVWYVTG